ncbi:MAG: arylsulfatase [Gemmatimonadetes bacterium]|nr:arylsulfatase [Gemmatimonadota bacterium]
MAEERPDVVLIMTDQQRGDCVGLDPNAPEGLQTPNMDWLGGTGAFFGRGYSECPSCIPARRSLMTGTAPASNGVVGFQGTEWHPRHTLAGELSRAGYQTEMIGKLHLSPMRKRYGFDHMQLADATRGRENDYVDWLRERHGRTEVDPGMAHGISANGWVGRPHHLPEEQMHTFWCVDRAMAFLKKRDPSTPFFLNLSFIDPHPPLTPPGVYYDRYINRALPEPVVGDWAVRFDAPPKGLDPDASEICLSAYDMQCARAAYYGMVNFIDDQIGRLIQVARGTLDECLIIFTSDHGEMLGDHHLFRKTWPFEASARVPFLIRPPRSWKAPESVTCRTPVGLQDIMPTILDACGLEVPETCTGRSLVPVVRGESDGVRDVLHGEHSGYYAYENGNHYVTDGRHKYVWFTQTGREHLFDLDEDPHELRDLSMAEGADELLSPLRKRLIRFLKGRPEGFTDGERLIVGRKHKSVMPGYEPEKMFPFL